MPAVRDSLPASRATRARSPTTTMLMTLGRAVTMTWTMRGVLTGHCYR